MTSFRKYTGFAGLCPIPADFPSDPVLTWSYIDLNFSFEILAMSPVLNCISWLFANQVLREFRLNICWIPLWHRGQRFFVVVVS